MEYDNLIHAKDGYTFSKLLEYCRERGYDNEILYHTTEDYVLTTKRNIIVYPGKYIYNGNICMMPENMGRIVSLIEKNNIINNAREILKSV